MNDLMQLFNAMRRDPLKRQIVEKYEHYCGPFKPYLEQNLFYTEYLSEFKTIPYEIPEGLPGFDYQLFMQCCLGNYTAKAWLSFPNDDFSELPELNMYVESERENKHVLISHLFSFQVLNIMDVFIIEQIQFQTLCYSDLIESFLIFQKREQLINEHNSVIETIELNRLLTSSQ